MPLTVVAGTAASGPLTLSAGTPGVDCTSEIGLSPNFVESLDQGGKLRIAVFDIDTESDFQLQTQQTSSAWIGDYDAADLSLLVSGWQSPPITASGPLREKQQ